MDRLKTAYQFSRIAIGAASFTAPSVAGRAFGVELDAGGQVIMRLFGVRDAILGVGQVLGERHGGARGWYEAAAVVDVADAAVFTFGAVTGALPRRQAVVGTIVALLGAAGGMYFARVGGRSDEIDSIDGELAELTRAVNSVGSGPGSAD